MQKLEKTLTIKILEDSFNEFRDENKFYSDLKKALQDKQYGPSFEKFKESLIYGNPFAIITARSTRPEIIQNGVKLFIGEVLNEKEMESMLDNIRRNYKEVSSEGKPRKYN